MANLTKDEAELYDRQLRLWGVNAQNMIRQSRVLMLGFNGVASEVAKILVLAGIDSLTIVDDQTLQETDIKSNLFCRPPADGQRTHQVVDKLKKLNPLVKVSIDNSSIQSKKPDEFEAYDVVTLHSFMTIDEISHINDTCRSNKVKFYLVLDYGFFGFMFNDLGENFSITVESTKPDDEVVIENDPSDEVQEEDRPSKRRRLHSPDRNGGPKTELLPYATFRDMVSLNGNNFDKQTSPVLLISIAMLRFFTQRGHLPRENEEGDTKLLNTILDSIAFPKEYLKKLDPDWIECIFSSLSPVCAVVGGVAGQDIIRAISYKGIPTDKRTQKDIPINNTFSFDGLSMNGVIERLGVSYKAEPIVTDCLQIDDDDD